jgi:hypothetical protein
VNSTMNRKNLRYKPDRLEFALVMFDASKGSWIPDDTALIIDESAVAGAQLVLKFTDRCKPGDQVRVKIGSLDPVLGEIVWRREIDSDLFRIGVRFLE